jgi:hypothetical protein
MRKRKSRSLEYDGGDRVVYASKGNGKQFERVEELLDMLDE